MFIKLKKLRTIYRVLFPVKIDKTELFENNLNSNNKILDFVKKNDTYKITLFNKSTLELRNHKHSDYNVFKQIFNSEEYKLVLSLLTENKCLWDGEKIFIDAGANVGYTTLYFSMFFNFDKIFCIEPSRENTIVLESNIESLINFETIKIYQNALTNHINKKFKLDNNFRDKRDWSITTLEDPRGNVEGITVREIIDENNLQSITLLKIDIEGAERFIFNSENDLSFLNIVKVIAIEIHDEFKIREEINSILKEHHFIIFESGELTIGINSRNLEKW